MVGGVCSGCFEVLEGGGGVDGVPGDYGVGEEGEAFALYVLVFCSSPTDLSLVGEVVKSDDQRPSPKAHLPASPLLLVRSRLRQRVLAAGRETVTSCPFTTVPLSSAIGTLVERTTQHTMLLHLPPMPGRPLPATAPRPYATPSPRRSRHARTAPTVADLGPRS